MGRNSKKALERIEDFDLKAGRALARGYEVVSRLGKGWEGEVYLVRERATGIERAAKLFYPHRNAGQKASTRYAKKLHKLRHCRILIQYHAMETMRFRGQEVPFLVSEFVEGEILAEFLKRQPGRRLAPFQALHLLHALCEGIESIHLAGEYHGDLHSGNVIVQRYGLGFELKLLDLFHWDASKRAAMQDDVVGLVEILYEAIGGQKQYRHQPEVVKTICRGMKKTLILERFRKASHLRGYLETLEWM